MEEIVILGGARTPIGSFGESLAGVPAAELGVIAGRAAIERAAVEPGQVDADTVGTIGQTGQDVYVGRTVGRVVVGSSHARLSAVCYQGGDARRLLLAIIFGSN